MLCHYPATVLIVLPYIQVEGDYVVYENRMSSTYEVAVGPLGSITRDSVYE